MVDTNDNDHTSDIIVTLHRAIMQHLQKICRKLEKQKEEYTESQKHLWYQQIGDSLLAICGTQNKRGQSKITLMNVYTQQEETVAINPKLDIKANAELFFKKAKKGKRGEEISTKKVDATEGEITEFNELKRVCEECIKSKTEPSPELIQTIKDTLAKYSQVPLSANDKSIHSGEKIPYRHIVIDEWNIYIGKTDTQNDELSIHFAKPSDIWLHVAGHAGSHVIIRHQKNESNPPHDVIEKAASMAVWFSKAKHTSYAEVHYTEARFVRKRRHAPAGEVMIDRFKTIRVSPKSPHDLFPSTFLTQNDEE